MSKISVKVKTNSRVESVEQISEREFVVRVRVPPVDGKANERVQELLADHFRVPKSSVQIVAGFKGKIKLFTIGPT